MASTTTTATKTKRSATPPRKSGGDDAAGKARVQVLSKIKNRDLTAVRNEYIFQTPFLVPALASCLKDQRDIPMLSLQLNILEVAVPGLVLVYSACRADPAAPWLAWGRHVIGIGYIVVLMVLFLERFVLMMHFSSHRSIFKAEWMNSMIVWIFAPIFGIPSGVYKLHHVIMHHIENNHELDISSTEKFQRDSWLAFGSYWLHFVALIWIELPLYAMKTKKWTWFWTLVMGLAFWLSTIALLATHVSFLATMYCFMIPYVIAMTALAFGNWSQHIFINPEDADSNYALTFNCIDSAGNQTTFNDGYHIIHHANARLHWTEIPEYFYQNQDKHINGGALTFREIHFFDIGILVMTKQLRKVAENYVHLGSEADAPTVEEVEAKLRSWLRPVPLCKTK